jgi:hypothetical protein
VTERRLTVRRKVARY